jgi:hypothetical protein
LTFLIHSCVHTRVSKPPKSDPKIGPVDNG